LLLLYAVEDHVTDGVVISECFSDNPGLGLDIPLLFADPLVPGTSES